MTRREVIPGAAHTSGYLTTAEKYFKWQAGGKVRLHKSPSAGEVTV